MSEQPREVVLSDLPGHPFRGNQWTDGSVEEGGKTFQTGKPVTFTYLHNTTRDPKRIQGRDDTFQQGIEPAGFYVNHGSSESQVEHGRSIGLESGEITLKIRS
jgi:hypothetical protein